MRLCPVTCYTLIPCSAYFRPWRWRWYSSETSVRVWNTRRCILEDGNMHYYRRENPKSSMTTAVFSIVHWDWVQHVSSFDNSSEHTNKKETPWPGSASELYRSSDSRLLPKLVPTFAARGWHVVSATVPYGRILGFLDQSRYFFFQVAPQLYSRGWVDPVPDLLLLRKSGSARNRIRTFRSVAGTLITRPQRRSTFFYITYINSVRTSQEAQYISVV
jgi:hypothetical protein